MDREGGESQSGRDVRRTREQQVGLHGGGPLQPAYEHPALVLARVGNGSEALPSGGM